MQKLKITFTYILGGMVLLGLVALAESLTPPEGSNTATPTMYTLSDIYNRLDDINYTPQDKTTSTTSSPAPSMRSLSEIWNHFPTIQADTIATGTSVMGIDGNIVIPTESQVESGVTFGPNNSLTGTLLAGTPPTEWSTAEYGNYTDWYTADTFCSDLVEDGHDDWRLPTYTELVDASPAGDNPVDGFRNVRYWSGTTYSINPDYAYFVRMTDMNAYLESKVNLRNIARCAR